MARKAMIEKAKKEPKYKTRKVNRCKICGRARAVYNDFGLCRMCVRKYFHSGYIPGMKKASW
jgi:small subunit ribosomal protein S14